MSIIITGLPSAGSKALGAYLHAAGVSFGSTEADPLPEAELSDAGFSWERVDVGQLNRWFLSKCGVAWEAPAGFSEDRVTEAILREFHQRGREVMGKLDASRPWFVKDAGFTMVLPYWQALIEAPVIVVAHRSPLDFASEYSRAQHIPSSVALALWEYHTCALLRTCGRVPAIFVSEEAFFVDPVEEGRRLLEALEEAGVTGLKTGGPEGGTCTAPAEPRDDPAVNLVLNDEQRALQKFLGSGVLFRREHKEVFTPCGQTVFELESFGRQISSFHGSDETYDAIKASYEKELEEIRRYIEVNLDAKQKERKEIERLRKMLEVVEAEVDKLQEASPFSPSRCKAAIRMLTRGAPKDALRVMKKFKETRADGGRRSS